MSTEEHPGPQTIRPRTGGDKTARVSVVWRDANVSRTCRHTYMSTNRPYKSDIELRDGHRSDWVLVEIRGPAEPVSRPAVDSASGVTDDHRWTPRA